jgi:hypothetical protein
MRRSSDVTELTTQQVSSAQIAMLVTAATAIGVWRQYAKGVLFSGSGGAHLNAALFVGVGGLAYVWNTTPERFSHTSILVYCAKTGWPFLGGYVLWLIIDPANRISPRLLVALFVIGFLSTLVCRVIPAVSGLLIILQVLKNLTYPAFTLLLIRSGRLTTPDLGIIAATSCAAGVSAFLSPWRSDLVIFGGCFFLAIVLRRPRLKLALVGVALTLIFALISLPFLQLKKHAPQRFTRDPIGLLVESQSTPIKIRVEMLVNFLGMRVDALREMAYVARGLDSRMIVVRNGASYEEAVLQLIPRVLWPSKPSYNQATGSWLPRHIGLLGMDDVSTSWGVNVYGEAIWNWGALSLLGFVPGYFLSIRIIDAAAVRLLKTRVMRTLVECQLFFLTFQMVGLVNATTYIVWTVLLAWLFENTMLQLIAPAEVRK